MKRASKLLGWTIYALCCTIIAARGQPAPGSAKTREYIDQEVKRHRWELNVNAGNLFRLGSGWVAGYYSLIKLNSKATKDHKGRAWRFALSPFAGNGKQYFSGDTLTEGNPHVNEYHFAPQFALGHEWQRSHGRAMFFGGVDLAGQLSRSKQTAYNTISPWDSNVAGRTVIRIDRNFLWLATFLGAKLYVNHRVSVSMESHLRLIYGVDGTRTWFEDKFIAQNRSKWMKIEALPYYLVNLSYNL